MSFYIDVNLLLEKYKIFLNTLPVYNNRYIKTKMITCTDKAFCNLYDLKLPIDGVKF